MKNKIGSAVAAVLTLGLISATAVAYTMASTTSANLGSKTNSFSNQNANVQLAEPRWNGQPYGSVDTDAPTTGASKTYTDYSNNDASVTTPASAFGQNMAKAYKPSQAIPKDPSLKNSSEIPEYLALAVDYKIKFPAGTTFVTSDSTGDGSQVSPYKVSALAADTTAKYNTRGAFQTALATLNDLDTDNWNDISPTSNAGRLYMNKNVVAPSAHTTTPLFKSVTVTAKTPVYIATSGTPAGSPILAYPIELTGSDYIGKTIAYVENYPPFDIELQGYAVQAKTNSYASNATASATTIDSANAGTALKNLYTEKHVN